MIVLYSAKKYYSRDVNHAKIASTVLLSSTPTIAGAFRYIRVLKLQVPHVQIERAVSQMSERIL